MIENYYNNLVNTPSDINEHLPTLRKYAEECDHITEMGVRGIISTWGWLSSSPKKLISYDIQDPSTWNSPLQDVYDTAEIYGIEFNFHLANVLEVEIDETDLLFLDTWHAYDQLKAELELHSPKAKKYILMHDTTSYEYRDEPLTSENAWEGDSSTGKGLWPAVTEFLEQHPEWELHKRFTNNNGLTIIKRVK